MRELTSAELRIFYTNTLMLNHKNSPRVLATNIELCVLHRRKSYVVFSVLMLTKSTMHNNWVRFSCEGASAIATATAAEFICANSLSAIRHWLHLWSQCTVQQDAGCIYNKMFNLGPIHYSVRPMHALREYHSLALAVRDKFFLSLHPHLHLESRMEAWPKLVIC